MSLQSQALISGIWNSATAFAIIYIPRHVFSNPLLTIVARWLKMKPAPSGHTSDITYILAVVILALGVMNLLAYKSRNVQFIKDSMFVRFSSSVSFLALTFGSPYGSAYTFVLGIQELFFGLWIMATMDNIKPARKGRKRR